MNILLSIIVWLLGLSFLVIMFPLTFIIWLIVLPFDKKRALIHWLLVYQGVALSFMMPIWRVKTEGNEKVESGVTYIIISNHQSILDILLLSSLKLRFKWISKIENTRLPFIGWYLKMAGYITVDRGNSESKEEMLEKAFRCLKGGTSIMIFPEGTRSPDGQLGFFKRGAFQLALNTNLPVLPVLIDGTGGILPKHGLIFKGGHRIRIKVFDPVFPESFGTINPEDLALKFNKILASALNEMRIEK
jgi:1-acyl-sn-glycerol-3-phosphate acyltransferase